MYSLPATGKIAAPEFKHSVLIRKLYWIRLVDVVALFANISGLQRAFFANRHSISIRFVLCKFRTFFTAELEHSDEKA
jgi:hypothetical protein